jgi:hypothetical protein
VYLWEQNAQIDTLVFDSKNQSIGILVEISYSVADQQFTVTTQSETYQTPVSCLVYEVSNRIIYLNEIIFSSSFSSDDNGC